MNAGDIMAIYLKLLGMGISQYNISFIRYILNFYSFIFLLLYLLLFLNSEFGFWYKYL